MLRSLEPRVMIRRCLFSHRNSFLVLALALLFAPLHVAAAAADFGGFDEADGSLLLFFKYPCFKCVFVCQCIDAHTFYYDNVSFAAPGAARDPKTKTKQSRTETNREDAAGDEAPDGCDDRGGQHGPHARPVMIRRVCAGLCGPIDVRQRGDPEHQSAPRGPRPRAHGGLGGGDGCEG